MEHTLQEKQLFMDKEENVDYWARKLMFFWLEQNFSESDEFFCVPENDFFVRHFWKVEMLFLNFVLEVIRSIGS